METGRVPDQIHHVSVHPRFCVVFLDGIAFLLSFWCAQALALPNRDGFAYVVN